MRIKRIAFTGTFLLVIGCLGLYLLLDRTLTTDHKGANNAPSYSSQIADKTQNVFNLTLRNSNVRTVHTHEKVCSIPQTSPKVNIQMSLVYDKLEFDNIDGGVWKQGWNIVYDERQWNEKNKLKIFVVPHSHNDPGWKSTFEEYYRRQTRSILNNMVKKLSEDSRRKFIWAEISFFALWWSEIGPDTKEEVKELLSKGQLEIVTGGWVMADEANSHYYAVLGQLIHGHQWLQQHLNYTPRHSWSIDPFGLSPSFPYLLKNSGLQALAVQRSHYSVKKYLARNKFLEFRWRQLWDGDGTTELLTHMMPFYSYDVPHTCGPDPKICCQFDFKRLPGYGLSCPWKVPPQPITSNNVAQKAALLLDQYRKKAQLYSTNVVMVPLGDDFRYDRASEWDAQFLNYQKLFDHINQNTNMHAEAQFGTLSDYFNALKEERPEDNFPTLSGDFFTYADRDDHYWSGYYTSRPFYKRMDRVLMSYLRSAEILFSMASRKNRTFEGSDRLQEQLFKARSSMSLFQHHDGITGTAKAYVVQDYGAEMLEAIRSSQNVIQHSANFLLSQGKESQIREIYFILDDNKKMNMESEQTVLKFPTGIPARHVTFFNPLMFHRKEVVTLKVENMLIQVKNQANEPVPFQISPICSILDAQVKCFQLSFIIDIGPLSLVTYSIEPAEDNRDSHVSLKLFNANWGNHKFDDWKEKEIESERDFSIENENYSIAFNKMGLLKAVTLKAPESSITVPIHLSFVKYAARSGQEQSGAYLFLPEGEAETVSSLNPRVTIVEGKIMSQVIVQLPNVVHVVVLYNSPGADSRGIEIQNLVNIVSIQDNYELAMRFSSDINNGNIFYTDLNGIQVIKRKKLNKLPLQGNYYPLGSAVYIEDTNTRLTVLSGQPLGVASLRQGQIEIMQDRKLMQDDNRGLDEAVTDNKPTLTVFRLSVETLNSKCAEGRADAVWGHLSREVHESLDSLLYPVHALLWQGDPRAPPSSFTPAIASNPPPSDIHLVTAHNLNQHSTGIVLHKTLFDSCTSSENSHQGNINLTALLGLSSSDKVFRSSLTFNELWDEVNLSHHLQVCDIDTVGYVIKSN